jgi:hypothetical protein
LVERFGCQGNDSSLPIQILGTTDGYEAAALDVETGIYWPKFVIPFNRTSPHFTYLNSCSINPEDNLCYCTIVVGGSNYMVRVDGTRLEFVANLPDRWDGFGVRFNSGAFNRNGTYFFSSFSGAMYKVSHSASLLGFGSQDSLGLADFSFSPAWKVNHTGGFGDMVVVFDDLTGSGIPEEFILVLNSWLLVILQLTGEKLQYWLAPVDGLKGLVMNFGAGWNFGGHVFFASNQGLGVFEIPLDDIFLYDCRDHYCPAVKLQLIGKSERTGNNDGLFCWGGSNPWKTVIKPFDCERVSGIMKAYNHDTGYYIMGMNISSGGKSALLSLPYARTDPPFTSLSSVSLNPKDDIFYGILTVGDLPYLIRFDSDKIEFAAKLPYSEGGYVGGSFSTEGHYTYSSLIEPPVRYRYESVHNLKGYPNQTVAELQDFTDKEPMGIADAKNATPTGMSGLVTVRSNFEDSGNEQDYVLGVDATGKLVITKDNCTHHMNWFVETASSASGEFGSAYSFEGKVYFEAKDGSGVYELPLDGFNVDQDTITMKMAGTSQTPGGTDFAGWSEDGFNCMKSPTPFYSGDCQLSYHEVPAEADGGCPAGSVEI